MSILLLAHFDDALTDSSLFARTITAGGSSASYQPGKFGNALVVNSSLHAYTAWDSSLDFGTGDFCFDFWAKVPTLPSSGTVFALIGSTLRVSVSLSNTSGSYYVRVVYKDAGGTKYTKDFAIGSTPSTTAYSHYAVNRASGQLSAYFNGSACGASQTASESISTAGTYDLYFGYGALGYLDEVRICDTSNYSGAFTPPSSPYADPAPVTPAIGAATCSATVAGAGLNSIGAGASAASLTVDGRAPSPAVGAATPALSADAVGEQLVELTTPIVINRIISVSVGLPIRFNLESAVSTVSVPIHLGTLLVSTVTLPIHINVPTAVSTVTLPIRIYGDISTEALADFVQWRVGASLNGTDISDKLIGAGSVEFEEMASPIAAFSFLPANGTVDPLAYVNQSCVITWQRVVGGSVANTALLFTGIVSDPTWDADERILSISATGDMQARYDRTPKAQILASLAAHSPSYSEYVFGPEADLSGWEYAEALLSTTNAVLWVDAGGVLRATSTLAKATADYTFGTDDIIAGSLGDSPQYPGRQEMVNKITVDFDYRFQRRRERRIRCTFRDIANLDTPAIYLSGNLGGWELPQRTQVESAANSGGWTVIGDISYSAVWPSGTYQTYSDSGGAMWEGWSNTPGVTDELCIGATWTAARRWLQTVTETATLVVNATESQEIIGLLADNESYSIEDEATDEEWESSLEYTDYVSGATLMLNGVDKRSDLDELRSAFEAAQVVALAKAKHDILRAHRGTTVTFGLPLAPSLDLSHTVAVDTAYLDCKGKVRRLTHAWDIDSGDATTTVDVALFRHNGAGLLSDTTLAATAKAADPTEAAPATTMAMAMYIGGQDDRPLWSTVENESGYFVNLPFNPTYGTATLIGSWQRNPANPAVAVRVYEEGFAVKYPDIAATYANPTTATTTTEFEVVIPEDPLIITSG